MQNTQMPGSRTRYALDLDDVIAFPDIAHIPVLPPNEKESWYILTEVSSTTRICLSAIDVGLAPRLYQMSLSFVQCFEWRINFREIIG